MSLLILVALAIATPAYLVWAFRSITRHIDHITALGPDDGLRGPWG